MEKICISCGNRFCTDELCRRCAELYNSTICLRCCSIRGICYEHGVYA